MLKSRSFNTIEVFHERGIVRKSSANVEKLKAEVLFYINCPAEIKKHMPILHEYAADYSWYDMEYIEYETLAETVTRRDLLPGEWGQVFNLIHGTISTPDADLGQTTFSELYEMLIKKALNRAKILDHVELKKIFFARSTINGRNMKSLAELLVINCGVLFKVDADIATIHGDLCFSNILISDDLKKIKIIDPRGGFDEPSIFGPAVYDIAKLAQSIYTWYDKILEGQYLLERSDEGYVLDISGSNWSNIAGSAFFAVFGDVGLSEKDLKILAGLMLAGTPALHLDDPDRAVALALNAVLLLAHEGE